MGTDGPMPSQHSLKMPVWHQKRVENADHLGIPFSAGFDTVSIV